MTESRIESLLRELRRGLQTLYGDRLRGVYLYGSYARGESDEESDVDVLIVVDQVGHYATEIERTSQLSSDLSLRHNLSISRVFVSEDDWSGGTNSFLARARMESLPV